MSSFCICKSYSHFFSAKILSELAIAFTRTVIILTTCKFVKLIMFWTTRPWFYVFLRAFVGLQVVFFSSSCQCLSVSVWWVRQELSSFHHRDLIWFACCCLFFCFLCCCCCFLLLFFFVCLFSFWDVSLLELGSQYASRANFYIYSFTTYVPRVKIWNQYSRVKIPCIFYYWLF